MHNEALKISYYPIWGITLWAVDTDREKKDARIAEDEWEIKRRYSTSIYLII